MRALIVDDHPLFIDVIRPVVERMGASEVFVATTGNAAVEAARDHSPDVVLVDIGLPDRSGLSVGRDILQMHPEATVVALTGLDDRSLAREVLKVGFRGYVTKDVSLDEFRSSLRAILRGTRVKLIPNSDGRRRRDRGRTPDARMLASHLTSRELEVLTLLVQGLSGADIATKLSISRNTVRTHIQSILTKLQVHSRLEAAAFAVRHAIVQA